VSRALAAALEKLLAVQGSAAATQFTPAQRRELDSFARQTGALRLITQGRGASYQIINTELTRSHLEVLRPSAEADLDPSLPARANNIARMRNSKARRYGHGISYLLLKAIGANVIWYRDTDIELDVSINTTIAGATAIAITAADDWHTPHPIWLVENQALFDRLDWLPVDAHGSVVYYGGQLSNLFLDWMAQRQRTEKIFFFPDYDGVGLLNYCRLIEKSRTTIEFWLMPDWLELLQKYGNNTVWEKTRKEFDAALTRLVAYGMPHKVAGLCDALSSYGLALEHEVVWLKT
jgi:hypothetical protein